MKLNSSQRHRTGWLAITIMAVVLLALGALPTRAGQSIFGPYRKLAMKDPEAARKTIRLYNLVYRFKLTPQRRIDDRMVQAARSCLESLLSLNPTPEQRYTLSRLHRVVGELNGLTVREAAALLSNLFLFREG